jgi:hypothetical protein
MEKTVLKGRPDGRGKLVESGGSVGSVGSGKPVRATLEQSVSTVPGPVSGVDLTKVKSSVRSVE